MKRSSQVLQILAMLCAVGYEYGYEHGEAHTDATAGLVARLKVLISESMEYPQWTGEYEYLTYLDGEELDMLHLDHDNGSFSDTNDRGYGLLEHFVCRVWKEENNG